MVDKSTLQDNKVKNWNVNILERVVHVVFMI